MNKTVYQGVGNKAMWIPGKLVDDLISNRLLSYQHLAGMPFAAAQRLWLLGHQHKRDYSCIQP